MIPERTVTPVRPPFFLGDLNRQLPSEKVDMFLSLEMEWDMEANSILITTFLKLVFTGFLTLSGQRQ